MDLDAVVEDLDVIAIDDSRHSSPVYRRLSTLRKKGSSCDFDIVVGGDKIPVHRSVISSKSKYFQAILVHGTAVKDNQQIELKEIDKDSVVMCVDYMYGEPVRTCKRKWAGLVRAAEMLEIDILLDSIGSYLERKLTPYTFREISALAINSLRGLKLKCVELAASNLEYLIDAQELDHLDAEFFEELFGTEMCASEGSKVTALLEWTCQDRKHRRETFDSCFHKLDLSKVAISFRRFLLEEEPLIKDSWPNLRRVSVSLLDSAGIQPKNVTEIPEENGILLYYGQSIGSHQFSCVSRETQPFRVEIPTHDFSAVYLPGYIYCFAELSVFEIESGGTGKFTKTVERQRMQYDHGVQPTVVTDGRYIYAVLGSRCGRDSCIEQFNPIANTWRCLTWGRGLSCHACVFFGGKIFCIGGMINGRPIASVCSFHVVGNAWTVYPSLPVPRMSSAAAALGDLIYVIGGHESVPGPTNANLVFDTRTNAWSSIAPMRHRREGCGAFSILGDIYVCGGCHPLAFSHIERYDVSNKVWEEIMMPFRADLRIICSAAVVLPSSH